MSTGFIVGKFCPLHLGHEFLIEKAKALCSELYILSYTNPEFANCGVDNRLKWFQYRFPDVQAFVLGLSHPFEVGATILRNDADEELHRSFCAQFYQKYVGKNLDYVFTSEHYGEAFVRTLNNYFAKYGQLEPKVVHKLIDPERKSLPISASQIRKDPYANRKFLSSFVYKSFVKTVCILGGESSGKTTLTEALARKFETQYVSEYGRTLWEQKNGNLEFSDMLKIAVKHNSEEERLIADANKFLFIDTSALTTWLYSHHYFCNAAAELTNLANKDYDYIFLCSPDFPFVQDGTRINDEFRQQQHLSYIEELGKRKLKFQLISGSLENRVSTVSKIITKEYKNGF